MGGGITLGAANQLEYGEALGTNRSREIVYGCASVRENKQHPPLPCTAKQAKWLSAMCQKVVKVYCKMSYSYLYLSGAV